MANNKKNIVESTIKNKNNKIKEADITFNLQTNIDYSIDFTINMNVLIEPAMRPRTALDGRIYDPLATYKKIIEKQLKKFLNDNNFNIIEDAYITTELYLYLEPCKSLSKMERLLAYQGLIRPTKKPDVDNCEKTIFDILNDTLYKDDSQIVSSTTEKHYDLEEKTYFKAHIVPKQKITERFNNKMIYEIKNKSLREKIKGKMG